MKVTTSDRLKEIMVTRGLRQVDILELCKPYSERFGVKICKNDLSQYVSGKVKPGQDKLSLLAMALNVKEIWLMGYDVDNTAAATTFNKEASTDCIIIPVFPRVAAGVPVEAIEDAIDTVGIPSSWVGDYYGIRVVGDSMEPKICEGDYVIARSQNDAESGEIVVALINGRDACVKKLIKYPNGSIALQSFNPKYEPMMFDQTEIDSTPVKIIGRVVENRQHY